MTRAQYILELFGMSTGAQLKLPGRNRQYMQCRSCGYIHTNPEGVLAPIGIPEAGQFAGLSNIQVNDGGAKAELGKSAAEVTSSTASAEKSIKAAEGKPSKSQISTVFGADSKAKDMKESSEKCPKCGKMMEKVSFASVMNQQNPSPGNNPVGTTLTSPAGGLRTGAYG